MFRLTRTKYIVALESAEAMQRVLEKEMENLGVSNDTLSNNWFGLQAENNFSLMNTSLQAGNHRKAYAYTKGMTDIMGEYLPEIEKMMAKREQIGKQLNQDSYDNSNSRSFCETELVVDYAYIDDIKADAEGAVFYAEQAVEILQEMIDEVESCAGDYVDLTVAIELLREGKKKINRIENYRDEFVDFAKKMSDLEYNMSRDLSAIMREQGVVPLLNAPMVEVELNQESRIEQMNESDEELLIIHMKEKYGETGVALLQQDENGKYHFEGLLSKDIEELTEDEINTLAYLYSEIYKEIEDADYEAECKYSIMLAEKFSEGLLNSSIKEEARSNNTCKLQFYVVSNDALIDKLMSSLSIYENENGRSLGMNYLQQIRGTDVHITDKISGYVQNSEYCKEKAAQVSIHFDEDKIGLNYNFEYYPELDGAVKILEDKQIYLCGFEDALRYVEGLDAKEYSNLTELGYDPIDIANMYTMAHNKDDITMVMNLMQGKEAEIFKVDPEKYSGEMLNVLGAYGVKLGTYDMEHNDMEHSDTCERLENFINCMLSPENDYEHIGEYMEIMAIYSRLQRDAGVVSLWASEGLDYDLIQTVKDVDAITSVYQTLYLEGTNWRNEYLNLTYQFTQLCVRELKITDGRTAQYKIVGYLNSPDEEGTHVDFIEAQTEWGALENNANIFSQEMASIENEIDNLWLSYSADALICGATLVDKNLGLALKTIKALTTGNIKTAETSVTRMKINGEGATEGFLCAADVFGIYVDYVQKKEGLEKEWKKQADNSMISWFYSGHNYSVNYGEIGYYDTGIYEGHVIEAIKGWNKEGLSYFYPGDVEELADELLVVTDKEITLQNGCTNLNIVKGYDNNEKCKVDALLQILYGEQKIIIDGEPYVNQYTNVVEIPSELFLACMQDISHKQDDSVHGSWLFKIDNIEGDNINEN